MSAGSRPRILEGPSTTSDSATCGSSVRRDWWGSGLATHLHAVALQAADGRRFTTLRLHTPADHGRARRFYEREGWTPAGQPFDDEAFGMAIVEYRREL